MAYINKKEMEALYEAYQFLEEIKQGASGETELLDITITGIKSIYRKALITQSKKIKL